MRGGGGVIAGAAIGVERPLVIFLRGLAPADRAAQIGDALAQHEPLGPRVVGGPERGERLLVMADGVLIGVGRAGPIAGNAEEARPLRLVRAEAEMMAEGEKVLEPLDAGRQPGFERASRRGHAAPCGRCTRRF